MEAPSQLPFSMILGTREDKHATHTPALEASAPKWRTSLLPKSITWACPSTTDGDYMLLPKGQALDVSEFEDSLPRSHLSLRPWPWSCGKPGWASTLLSSPPKSKPSALTSLALGFLIRWKWVGILVLIKNFWPLTEEVRGRQICEKSSKLQAELKQRAYFGMKDRVLWGRKKQMNILCHYISQTSRYKWVGQV